MRRRWSAKRVHFVLLPSVPVDPVLWRPLRWRICYRIDTRKPTRGPSERIKKTQTIHSHSARWQWVPLWSVSARVLTWLSSTLLRRIPDFWREQRSSWQATRTSKRLSKLCAWRVRPSECDAPSPPSRRLRRLQPKPRFDRVAHDEFLDFAGDRHRKLVDELDIARDFVVGDLALTEGADLVGPERFAGARADPGAKLFAIAIVGHAEDLRVLDFGMAIEKFLDLARVEV